MLVLSPAKAVRPSSMQSTLVFFMVASAVATLAVLARGIIIMARGQDVTGEQSNRMMSLRVALQALAIFFIVILFLINRPG
jgi:hypothetical protein